MNRPTLSFWSWRRALPQVAAVATLVIVLSLVFPQDQRVLATILAPSIFLIFSFGSRYFIAAEHRKGLAALLKEDFDSAVSHFEQSAAFFSRHAWLDQHRAWTMMTSSVWTYREMSLMNIAAIHSQKGEIAEAKKAYRRVLDEYPQNCRAAKALVFIEAVAREHEGQSESKSHS